MDMKKLISNAKAQQVIADLESSLEHLFDIDLPQFNPRQSYSESLINATPTFHEYEKELKESFKAMIHDHSEQIQELESHATPLPSRKQHRHHESQSIRVKHGHILGTSSSKTSAKMKMERRLSRFGIDQHEMSSDKARISDYKNSKNSQLYNQYLKHR